MENEQKQELGWRVALKTANAASYNQHYHSLDQYIYHATSTRALMSITFWTFPSIAKLKSAKPLS